MQQVRPESDDGEADRRTGDTDSAQPGSRLQAFLLAWQAAEVADGNTQKGIGEIRWLITAAGAT